jgi:hypothetical protein
MKQGLAHSLGFSDFILPVMYFRNVQENWE